MEVLAKKLESMSLELGLTSAALLEKFEFFLKTEMGVETNPAKVKGWSTTSEVEDETSPEGEVVKTDEKSDPVASEEEQPETTSDDVEREEPETENEDISETTPESETTITEQSEVEELETEPKKKKDKKKKSSK